MIKFDHKGQSFNFKMPDGRDKYQTCLGGLCFIFTSSILLLYSLTTLVELVERQNYFIINTETEGDLTRDYSNTTFGYDDGFAVAAAVSGAGFTLGDGNEDPEIGSVKFVIKYWDYPTDPV